MENDKIRYIRASDKTWRALKRIAATMRVRMGYALEGIVDFYVKKKGIGKRRASRR